MALDLKVAAEGFLHHYIGACLVAVDLEAIAEDFIRDYIESAATDYMGVAEDHEYLTDSQVDDVIELVRSANVSISWEQ